MRPERRIKPGVDGGLRAASWSSPPHHLKYGQILSNLWGPPQKAKFHGNVSVLGKYDSPGLKGALSWLSIISMISGRSY